MHEIERHLQVIWLLGRVVLVLHVGFLGIPRDLMYVFPSICHQPYIYMYRYYICTTVVSFVFLYM